MKRTYYLPILAVALLCAGTAVNAQYGVGFDTTQPNWNVHAGAAWMLGDTPDDVELIVGLGYEIPLEETDSRNWLGISADYVPVSSRSTPTADTRTVSLVPALAYFKRMGILGSNRVWGAVGLGFRWAEDDIPEMNISDGLDFAWTVQAGVDFDPQLFGDVRYIAGDDPGDDGIVTTELGWRF